MNNKIVYCSGVLLEHTEWQIPDQPIVPTWEVSIDAVSNSNEFSQQCSSCIS